MLYTKNELLKKLEKCGRGYSDEARSIIDNIIVNSFSIDEEKAEFDFENLIFGEIDSSMIYYSDAWSYLQDNNITDFEDAIKEYEAYNITSIACYYLQQEVYELLNDMEVEW